jgi:hypothetical protein
VLVLALLSGTVSGCREGGAIPRDPELAEALGVSARTEIHRVDLVTRGGMVVALPTRVELSEGALLQFVTRDWLVYSVRLRAVDPEGDQWIEGTRQRHSPPLVEKEARYVLNFEGAPPGDYPFEVVGQGSNLEGTVRVR